MTYGASAFSQAGYSDSGGAASSPNLIESLGAVTTFGVMVSPVVGIFAGLSVSAVGTFEGSSEFVPRAISGNFDGLAATQLGEMLGHPGHAIIGADPFTKFGSFVGASGVFSGAFAGVALAGFGEFSGELTNQYRFDGLHSTAIGVFSRPLVGQFAGVSGTRYGTIEGPAPASLGYDAIHVLRKPASITVFRSH